jgi:Fe-S-cluster-containing dehydrogenase component/formate-dependent nitrite reductase membrane component NrfD
MQYGFVIDNRKCIGCHACTTACKQEHEVPLGVFRTWVKQVEKGQFPNTRRVFSVMRCNHCTDAPCVEICPTEALFIRKDGIVDFDKDRCIGCRSCMQACPYDALYIDPDTRTAAKCNYCAHRTDIGLEPACVNVCPEHAIISGDLHNSASEIAQLVAREQVTARKVEKGTKPNLFYINGDDSALIPTASVKPEFTALTEQTRGVGHFAPPVDAEKSAYFGSDLIATLMEKTPNFQQNTSNVGALVGAEMTKRYYDAPDKGVLWGADVAAYVWTKAIAAGVFMVAFFGEMIGFGDSISAQNWWSVIGIGLVFLAITTFLLVKDLDQAKRFVYVLLRPQWKSWLVKGGYALTFYGIFLSIFAAAKFFDWYFLEKITAWLTFPAAVLTAVYTAFLFAQAKGRDFWQSPMLAFHMIGHSISAGAAALILVGFFAENSLEWSFILNKILCISLIFNSLITFFELTMPHPTSDARMVVTMILRGRYQKMFWFSAVLMVLPIGFLYFELNYLAAISALVGMFFLEKIWVDAPQRIALS